MSRALGWALVSVCSIWLQSAAALAEPEAAPPPPAAAPEPASADVQLLSEDELSALGLDSSKPALDTSLILSGFADFGFSTLFAPENSFWRASGTAPARSTFFVGNLNIYLSKQLTETLSTMIEVRFGFLPNGSTTTGFGFGERENTTAYDYTDFGRATRWGSIIIQRVYVEWKPDALFGVRGGQFLSPFGVWNVDHGSPVLIPIRRPWSIGVGWIPERQTGLELFGRARLSAENVVGYHLTLSNGKGPISEYADLDANKAIGGRLYWEFQRWGSLRLGVSGYYGRYTDSTFEPQISPMLDGVTATEKVASQYDALTWAFDLTWDLGNLHVQSEWLYNQQAYTKRGRAPRASQAGTIVPSDVISWGGYGLIGYRFSWFGVMPFVLIEPVRGDQAYNRADVVAYQFGLNIRPVDMLVLKAVYEHVEQSSKLLDPIDLFMAQVAWAF